MVSPWEILPLLEKKRLQYPKLAKFMEKERVTNYIESKIEFLPPTETFYRSQTAEAHTHIYPARTIDIYKNVSFIPFISTATAEDQIISETFMSKWRARQAHEFLRKYPIQKHVGYAAAINLGTWYNHYHYYVISLSRLFALWHSSLLEIPSITLFINAPANATRLAILKKLLPPNVSLHPYKLETRIKPEHYIHLPYIVSEWDGFLPKKFIEFYRQHAFEFFNLKPIRKYFKQKLYISREAAEKRRFINDNKIRIFLKSQGYKTLQMEGMSLREQARHFRNASHIIVQHGAAMKNLIYANKARVLEIHAGQQQNDTHYQFSCLSLGHDHHFIELNQPHKHCDAYLPLEKLDPFLALG